MIHRRRMGEMLTGGAWSRCESSAYGGSYQFGRPSCRNFKLMRRRFRRFQRRHTSSLAGALGCYLARASIDGLFPFPKPAPTYTGRTHHHLRRLSHVAFFNSLRQPLFEFELCLGYGKLKAENAPAGLKKDIPSQLTSVCHFASTVPLTTTAQRSPSSTPPPIPRLVSPHPSGVLCSPRF